MEEYRDDIKSKLHYMDEILHKISSMSQAENEKQLDDMTPSILKSVGKYTAADRAYIFEWNSEKKEVLKDKELNLSKKEEDYQSLLKLNQNMNDAFANLENAKNAVVKAETVKTDLAAKVKKLEKSLDQLTMEYTKLNSEKDKVDTLKACYNNLKEKKLDTEVLTIDGYESICTLLKQYKAALLDLNEKEQAYQVVKDKFDVVNTAYQKAKAGYDQAVIQETNTKNDLKKHLEEGKEKVEKKQDDTKQSSSVNTGVETAIAGLGMATMLGAAGAVVATRKLSRKEKHAKK